MATKIAIVGKPNSGKSFSRTFLKNPEEVFVLMPSQKAHYLKKDGKPLERLTFNGQSTDECLEKVGGTKGDLVSSLGKSGKAASFKGNWDVVKNISDVDKYLKFINAYMPHIKVIILPDFTHFISNVISSPVFIARKAGNEAFQRYLDLAAESLNTFFNNVDSYRQDLIVVTEYHTEYDEQAEEFKIFTPGGKMLVDKFMPDSYYDIFLHTYVNSKAEEMAKPDNYKFVTKKWGKYNARDGGLFEEMLIPNNLQMVLDAIRKDYNI